MGRGEVPGGRITRRTLNRLRGGGSSVDSLPSTGFGLLLAVLSGLGLGGAGLRLRLAAGRSPEG